MNSLRMNKKKKRSSGVALDKFIISCILDHGDLGHQAMHKWKEKLSSVNMRGERGKAMGNPKVP